MKCDEIPQRVGQQHAGHKPPTLSRRTEHVYAAIAAVLLRPLRTYELSSFNARTPARICEIQITTLRTAAARKHRAMPSI